MYQQGFILDKQSPYVVQFSQAMDDDFNTPQAIAVLFEIAKELNVVKDTNTEQAVILAATLKALGGVIGLLQLSPSEFLQGEK